MQTPGNFPNEVMGTPTSSRGGQPSNDGVSELYEDDLEMHCTCRMQIAEEENKLFAHTLAVSYVQDALPLVPHLSFEDEENDIVRVQDEVSCHYQVKKNDQNYNKTSPVESFKQCVGSLWASASNSQPTRDCQSFIILLILSTPAWSKNTERTSSGPRVPR